MASVVPIFPNRCALAVLMERFPDLRKSEAEDGALVARCPVVHEGEVEGQFVAREHETGWAISPCNAGCLPSAIWESTAIDGREVGADDDSKTSSIKPSRWGLTTATEFLAREFPPPRWLYLNLVPAESVTVVMAAPNAGKTFFGLDVLAQVAAKAAADGRSVVMVEEEGTGQALQWRLSRALASVGIDAGDPRALLIRIAWNTGRSLRNKADLASLAAECKGAELIMLDSLSALSGGINENDSQEMAAVAEALHVLKTLTGAALLVLHHMTKAAWKEGETPRLEHMRGHGALPGRADAVLALVPLESDETEVRFELHCVKQRDGSKPKPRNFSIAMAGSAASVTIEEMEVAPRQSRAAQRSNRIAHLVLLAIPEEGVGKPLSRDDVCDSVRARRNDVKSVIGELIDLGKVRELGHGKLVRYPTTGATDE